MRYLNNLSFLNKKSVLALILFLATVLILPMACEKGSQNQVSQSTANQQLIKEQLLAMIQKNGRSYTVPVYQKMMGYYGDAQGNRFVMHKPTKTIADAITTESISSSCDGDPNGYATLNTYTLTTSCIQGYMISFNTTVSTDDNIVATNGRLL